MLNKLVSIVVPVYNVEGYLESCINDILNQSYHHIEVILVDDGSTDKSGELCDKYCELDSRIIVIHQINKGVSAARNCGVRKSQGDYVMFVDADDRFSPEIVSKLVEVSELHSADISLCGLNIVDLSGNVNCGVKHDGLSLVKKSEVVEGFFSDPDYKAMLYGPYNKLFRRNTICDIEFDTSLSLGEDLLYVFQSIVKSKVIAKCDEGLYDYIKRQNSASTSSYSDRSFDYIRAVNRIVSICCEQFGYAKELADQWLFENELVACRQLICNPKYKKKYSIQFEHMKKNLKRKRKYVSALCFKRKCDYFLVCYFQQGYRLLRYMGVIR